MAVEHDTNGQGRPPAMRGGSVDRVVTNQPRQAAAPGCQVTSYLPAALASCSSLWTSFRIRRRRPAFVDSLSSYPIALAYDERPSHGADPPAFRTAGASPGPSAGLSPPSSMSSTSGRSTTATC